MKFIHYALITFVCYYCYLAYSTTWIESSPKCAWHFIFCYIGSYASFIHPLFGIIVPIKGIMKEFIGDPAPNGYDLCLNIMGYCIGMIPWMFLQYKNYEHKKVNA